MQEKYNKNNSNNQKFHSSVGSIVEAQLKAYERFEKLTCSSGHIAEMLKQQRKATEKIRRITEPPLYLIKMLEQIRQQQRMYAGITNTFKKIYIPDYTFAIKSMTNRLKLANTVKEALKQFHQAFDTSNIFNSMIEGQREAQRLLEVLKPSFQIQKSLSEEIARMNDWQNSFKSLTASLQNFRPTVEVLKDALVIENERFSQEQITQIAEEYIWDSTSNNNLFQQTDDKKFWELVPKPVRCLIFLIIATIFTIYFNVIYQEATKDTALSPERIARRLVHFRKKEVRQISKGQISEIKPPFVNTEYLHLHINPKRNSKIIAELFYPYEVNILEFRKKKRWALVEWVDWAGDKHQGWTLARYIYRNNERE